MTLTNLITGLIGAVAGGLLGVLGTVLTMHQQRRLANEAGRQSRIDASKLVCKDILTQMIALANGLDGLSTGAEDSPEAEAANDAGQLIGMVLSALVEDLQLRSRVDKMTAIIMEWREQWDTAEDKKEKGKTQVNDYIRYVSDSIRAYLDSRPLPPDKDPPDLKLVMS